MKKLFLLVAAFVFFNNIASAQAKNKFQFSLGADITYVSNVDQAVFWGAGYGGSVQASYFFSEKVSGSFLAGYSAYPGVSRFGGDIVPAIKIIPVRAGVNYFVYKELYIAAQVGAGFFNTSGIGATSSFDFNGSSFSYSAQLGYQFKIKGKKRIDLSAKYEAYLKTPKNFYAAGGRVAYIF